MASRREDPGSTGPAPGGGRRPDAEQALIESEERFRSIFYGAPVGIALIDHDGRYLSVNPVRASMLGYSEEELLGRTYWEVTHPDDLEYDRRVNEEARAAGLTNYQLEKRFIRKDGSVQWTRITVAAVTIGSRQPAYYISLSEDITAQKESEGERAQLLQREQEARVRAERLAAEREAIMRQAAEGIIIADGAGAITFSNEAARRLHRWPDSGPPSPVYHDAAAIFTVDGDVFPPDQLPLMRAVRGGETVSNARWRVRFGDETDVIIEGSAVPVMHAGERVGAVLTVRDITDLYEMQQQKDAFLSAAAHDLRTPLTAVKGRLQMLERRLQRGQPPDPPALIAELQRIDANATRMIRLIGELLDVANIELGRPLRLTKRDVDLVALARAVIDEQQHFAEHHRIVLQTVEPSIDGTWDGYRLERVLANLISNAVKYSPGGGDIEVRVQRDAGMARLQVTDHGVGIPEADLPHVFERFHRAANVGSIRGTGIGLWGARRIVEQHGGHIAVDSTVGEGTTVVVSLPCQATQDDAFETAEEPS